MRLVGSQIKGAHPEGAKGSMKELAAARAAEDLALARRCVAGDPAAQRRLFDAHRRRVHIILYRIFGSNLEMEDLVQEAFIAVYGSLANFRGEASLGTWVDRITTRVAYRHLDARRRARLQALDEHGTREGRDASLAVDPERETYHREVARRLYHVLEHLDPKLRVAFSLAVIDGRPQREVAEITGASRVAVKARVWRAQQHVHARAERDPVLREFLDQHTKGDA